MSKKPKYLMLYEGTFSERDYERFGCGAMGELGYVVLALDIADVFDPSIRRKMKGTDCQSRPDVQRISNLSDLTSILRELSEIDLVLCDFRPVGVGVQILRALSDSKCCFGFSKLGAIPSASYAARSFLALSGPIECVNVFARFAFGRGRNWVHSWSTMLRLTIAGIRPPFFMLSCGERAPETGAFPQSLIPIVEGHSLDFERLLATESLGPPIQGRYVVFLDEDWPQHSDYEVLGKKNPVTSEFYYKSLNEFFDKIESAWKLKVVIALHPRANPDGAAILFNGRTIIQGKTLNLIANAEVVIGHMSTSFGMAAHFRKSCLFITTNQIEKSPERLFIGVTSTWFGQKRLNVECIDSSYMPRKPVVYDRYAVAYVRSFVSFDSRDRNVSLWEKLAQWHEGHRFKQLPRRARIFLGILECLRLWLAKIKVGWCFRFN